jgi:hypothetical protein
MLTISFGAASCRISIYLAASLFGQVWTVFELTDVFSEAFRLACPWLGP